MIYSNSHSDGNTNNVALVFLGSRGGGPELLLEIARFLVESNKKITLVLSRKNENLQQIMDLDLELILVSPPNSRFSVITWLFGLKSELDRLIAESIYRDLDSFIFIQPHYLDYLIVKRLSRLGKRVTYTVHDYPPHRGEIFPPKSYTKMIIRIADRVIALNTECQRLLLEMNPNTFRSKLPIFRGKAEGIYPKTWDIAYVGRIKKYKGLNNLSKALGLLESSKFKVLVAGKGNLGTTFGSEVKMMNCWLTRDEIINHIRDSKILVLPYLEASQSGIMEIAKAFKTIVVITPVANLIEQVRDGGIGVVASSHEPRDLAKAILDAMTGAAIAYERDPLIPALNEFILEEINAWMDQ